MTLKKPDTNILFRFLVLIYYHQVILNFYPSLKFEDQKIIANLDYSFSIFFFYAFILWNRFKLNLIYSNKTVRFPEIQTLPDLISKKKKKSPEWNFQIWILSILNSELYIFGFQNLKSRFFTFYQTIRIYVYMLSTMNLKARGERRKGF